MRVYKGPGAASEEVQVVVESVWSLIVVSFVSRLLSSVCEAAIVRCYLAMERSLGRCFCSSHSSNAS